MEDSKRYYLHTKVREFTTVNAKIKEVIVSDNLVRSLSKKQKSYLNALQNVGYNLQQTMF